MKNYSLNPANLCGNVRLLPENLLRSARQFPLILLLICSIPSLFAQSGAQKTSDKIVSLTEFLSVQGKLSKAEDLLKNIQPSVYIVSNEAKVYGENPVCLFTDVQHLNRIATSEIQSDKIELVTIKINHAEDLNSKIDLSVFSAFPNLKYIYIVSTIPVEPIKIIKMVENSTDKLNVFYNITNAS